MTRQTTKPLIVLAFSVSPWRDQRTSPCSARPSRPLPCSPRTPPSPSSSSPRLSMRKMRPTDLTSLSRWRREPDRSTWRTWRVTTPPRPPSTLAQSSVSTCRLWPSWNVNKTRSDRRGLGISHILSPSLSIFDNILIFSSLCSKEEDGSTAAVLSWRQFAGSSKLGSDGGGLQHQHSDRVLHRHLQRHPRHHPGQPAQGYAVHLPLQVSWCDARCGNEIVGIAAVKDQKFTRIASCDLNTNLSSALCWS